MATSAPQLTLRERRRQETHDQIKRVALGLVRDRGYDAVTVDQISEGAGISVRTFFNYFPDKDSAMIASPPPIPEAAVEVFLSRRGSRRLFAHLADLVVTMFEDGNADPSEFETSMQIVMGVPALARLQAAALAERETQLIGLIASRLDLDSGGVRPAVIAAAVTAAIRVACQRWSANVDQRSFADEVHDCLTTLSTS